MPDVAENNVHTIAAHIAPGTHAGGRRQPTRTAFLGSIGPGGSVEQAIPTFATAVNFSVNNPQDFAITGIELEGLTFAGAGVAIWQQLPFAVGALSLSDFASFVLPVGTNFIRVNNTDGVDIATQARLVFQLDLN